MGHSNWDMTSNLKNRRDEEIEYIPGKGGKLYEEEGQVKMIQNARSDAERGGKARKSDWDEEDLCGGFWTGRMKCAVSSGVVFFTVIVVVVLMGLSVHKIQQGYVGIYFRSGALKDTVAHPGIHWMMPFITNIERIKIRPRTDTLRPIMTVTKDGIQNTFHNIQVISDVEPQSLVNLVKRFGLEFHETMVFDRVSEELRIFCANHTVDEVYNTMFLDIVEVVTVGVVDTIKTLGNGGIKIYHLTIPKPQIPPDIAKNYKEVKVQWTEQLVATQKQKTEKIKKDTETIKAVADAERQKQVLQIDIQKEILRKEGEQKLSSVENQILKDREQARADVENYSKKKLAEANQNLYTPDFIRLEMAKSLSQNTTFFFSGDNSHLGAVLTKIMDAN